MQGRLTSMEAVLDTLQNGKVFIDAEGKLVKFGNGMSIHIDRTTKEVLSVVPTKKVKDDWVPVK